MTFSSDLEDSIQHFFSAVETTSTIDDSFLSDLMRTLSQLDWLTVGITEDAGGPGGDIGHLAELCSGVGRNAVRGPILETAMAQWLHAEITGKVRGDSVAANYAITTNQLLRVSSSSDGWILDGTLEKLGWLRECECILVVITDDPSRSVALILDPQHFDSTVTVHTSTDQLDVPRSDLTFAATHVSQDRALVWEADHYDLRERAAHRHAFLRSAAMVGAAERVCSLSVAHVLNREQFGRPLAEQQAVAHIVAGAAAERDLMIAAVHRAIDSDGEDFSIAAAAAVVARGAGLVATAGHQLHGAVGITREHVLHLFTTRLWAWRDEANSQRFWEYQVGRSAIHATESDVWTMMMNTAEG
jgi:acyl-CoA dehydrogenase